MQSNSKHTRAFIILSLIVIAAFLINISLGSVHIPLIEILKALTGSEASKQSWQYIIVDYRLPKAMTAVFAGSGLAVAGLMMQTLFKNPLAGPFVLDADPAV